MSQQDAFARIPKWAATEPKLNLQRPAVAAIIQPISEFLSKESTPAIPSPPESPLLQPEAITVTMPVKRGPGRPRKDPRCL